MYWSKECFPRVRWQYHCVITNIGFFYVYSYPWITKNTTVIIRQTIDIAQPMYDTTLSAVGLVCCNEVKRSINIFVDYFLTSGQCKTQTIPLSISRKTLLPRLVFLEDFIQQVDMIEVIINDHSHSVTGSNQLYYSCLKDY